MTRSIRRLARLAVVAVAATTLTSVGFTAPAQAACGAGTPMAVAALGSKGVTGDFWSTETFGSTVVSIYPLTGTSPHLHAYDKSCVELPACNMQYSCTFHNVGRLWIEAHTGSGEYLITVQSAGVPAAGVPPEPGQCNLVQNSGVCAGVFYQDETVRQNVYNVVLGTAATYGVRGRIERFRFPLAEGSSALVPCPRFNNSGSGNPCAAIGGQYVDTYATLVDTTVDQPGVYQGEQVATVGVCEGYYFLTVLGFGVEQYPGPTLC